jgi:DNA-binding NtrC family response regulator
METLRMNRWNGNVRELENVIEYFIAVCDNGIVKMSDLPEDFFEGSEGGAPSWNQLLLNHWVQNQGMDQGAKKQAVNREAASRFLSYDETGNLIKKDHTAYSEALCERGNLEEYLYFLNLIKEYTDRGQTISRKTMAGVAKKKFPYLTEERVRKRTDDLQDLKLITKSAGRVGMRLTMNGVEYIRNNTLYNPIKADQ